MYDYAVMSQAAADLAINISVNVSGESQAHCGIVVRLRTQAQVGEQWSLDTPCAFAHPARPRRQTNPQSKRNRKRMDHDAKKVRGVARIVRKPTPRRRLPAKAAPPLEFLEPEAPEEK